MLDANALPLSQTANRNVAKLQELTNIFTTHRNKVDAVHKRALCRHAVCVCVCVCVTFVNSVKTSNRIVRLFSSSGSQTVLAFAYETLWRY